jgi:sodium-independent sulfate anion transporter 11
VAYQIGASTNLSVTENGIYTSIGTSLVLLLIRIARPRGHFLGRVRVRKPQEGMRDVYVPLKVENGVFNPNLHVDPPTPGVVVYRFEESFLYPNSSLVNSHIVDYVKEHTRRGQELTSVKLGDRPWNDAGPRHVDPNADKAKPLLHAVVLDFSSVRSAGGRLRMTRFG